jgi:hypothetical protein
MALLFLLFCDLWIQQTSDFSSSMRQSSRLLTSAPILRAIFNYECPLVLPWSCLWQESASMPELLTRNLWMIELLQFQIYPESINNVPRLDNPTSVVAGYHHFCALDNAGVHCWGERDPFGWNQGIYPPPMNQAALIGGGFSGSCAYAIGGIHCWVGQPSIVQSSPELNQQIPLTGGFPG